MDIPILFSWIICTYWVAVRSQALLNYSPSVCTSSDTRISGPGGNVLLCRICVLFPLWLVSDSSHKVLGSANHPYPERKCFIIYNGDIDTFFTSYQGLLLKWCFRGWWDGPVDIDTYSMSLGNLNSIPQIDRKVKGKNWCYKVVISPLHTSCGMWPRMHTSCTHANNNDNKIIYVSESHIFRLALCAVHCFESGQMHSAMCPPWWCESDGCPDLTMPLPYPPTLCFPCSVPHSPTHGAYCLFVLCLMKFFLFWDKA